MSSMFVLAPPHPEGEWGHGGWLTPEEREGLDWATLARLSGWDVAVGQRLNGGSPTWIVISADPDVIPASEVDALASLLQREPVCVITRAPSPGSPLAELASCTLTSAPARRYDSLRWTGPGTPASWSPAEPIDASPISIGAGGSVWATAGREPAIAVRKFGRGRVATLAFHPSAARDCDGAATAMLRRLLSAGAASPVAWLDLDGVMVLRMDDPGSPEATYHRRWAHRRLGAETWARIGAELARRDARMSLGYVMGWVDDGDSARGRLQVNGHAVPRIAGEVHPSPAVRYLDTAGAIPGLLHDLAAQARAIETLRRRGLIGVELHGFTHVHPDRAQWAQDPRRAEARDWYRELHAMRPGLDLVRPAAELFEHVWGSRATTLIPPGDAFNAASMRAALESELELVCSYYLALRTGREWWWAQHVCSPYLTRADSTWFRAGLPVVGYFHERDLAVEGVEWFADRLDEWEAAGARRFIDFRRLLDALACRPVVEYDGGEPVVRLGRPTAWPVPVKFSTQVAAMR